MSNYTWYSCGQKRKNCAWLENAKPELCRDKLKHPIRVLSRETKTFNTQLYCGDSHSMQHSVLHHTLHFQNSKIVITLDRTTQETYVKFSYTQEGQASVTFSSTISIRLSSPCTSIAVMIQNHAFLLILISRSQQRPVTKSTTQRSHFIWRMCRGNRQIEDMNCMFVLWKERGKYRRMSYKTKRTRRIGRWHCYALIAHTYNDGRQLPREAEGTRST